MIFVVIGKHYHEQNVYYYQVQPGRYGRDIEMMPPNMKAVRVGGVGGSLKVRFYDKKNIPKMTFNGQVSGKILYKGRSFSYFRAF